MMHRYAVSVFALFLLAACTNPTVQDDAVVVYSVDADDVQVVEEASDALDLSAFAALVGGETDVHFAFDSAAISPQAHAIIERWVAGLQQQPDLRVTVEGHCDERGSREYNLALGERRADAVRDLMVALGLEPARIDTISYGKERPLVEGHDPEAWAINRRGALVPG
jgi:peptidoglycan-associated lipoprotein